MDLETFWEMKCPQECPCKLEEDEPCGMIWACDQITELRAEIERLTVIANDYQSLLHRSNEIDDKNAELRAEVERLTDALQSAERFIASILEGDDCPAPVLDKIRNAIAGKREG